MTEDKIKAYAMKGCHYYNFEGKDQPAETIFFNISNYPVGNEQDLFATPRDVFDIENLFGKVNEEAARAYESFDVSGIKSSDGAKEKIAEAIAKSPYAYDKEKLEENKKTFVERCEEYSSHRKSLGRIRPLELAGYRFEKGDADEKEYAEYVKELLEGNDQAKTPYQRMSFMKKVKNFNYIPRMKEYAESLKAHIGDINPEHKKEVLALFSEEGKFPSGGKFNRKIRELNEKKEDAIKDIKRLYLRDDLIKEYYADNIEDAMKAKYFDKTRDKSILMSEKEQKRINEMSAEDVAKEMWTDVMTNRVSARIMMNKIAEEKKEGKDVSKALHMMRNSMDHASEVNFHEDVKQYIFDNLEKSYVKFAPDAKAYIEVFERLKGKNAERNVKIAEIVSGKKDVKEAKIRVKERLKDRTDTLKAGENVSGAVLADDIAKVTQRGFEAPTDKAKMDRLIARMQEEHGQSGVQKSILQKKIRTK